MVDEQKKNEEQEQVMNEVEVVPLNVILGELEIIKQKLYAHVVVLSTPEVKPEDVKDK